MDPSARFVLKDERVRAQFVYFCYMCLEDTIVRHNLISRRSLVRPGEVVKMEDFDKKLTETDCYLQMLINQNTELEGQLNAEGGEAYQPLVEKVK